MSSQQIARLSDEAAADAQRRNRHPWVAGSYLAEKPDKLFDAMRSMPNMGSYRPASWELVERGELKLPAGWAFSKLTDLWAEAPYLMVDKGGWGGSDSRSLSPFKLRDLIAANPLLGWAIVEEGQFQIVVGVFRKLDRVATRDQSEDRQMRTNIEGVAKAFVAGKPAKCHNADTNGKRYRLHASDIVTKQPDGSYLFDWCGYHTRTTAAHMNEVLSALGASRRVSYARGSSDESFVVWLQQ